MEERSRFKIFFKKHYKLIILFFIRLAEVFISSIIPSFLGVVLIFLNPNKNIWTIINFITLIGFAFINFRFLLKYIAGRDNKKEFYILNSIVYIIYVAVSILAFKFGGYVVYSMIFANLRGLEAFGMKTIHSILICDVITLLSIFILGKYAYSHIEFVKKLVKMNGADAVEIVYEEAVPMQHSEEINTLSVEEMEKEIEKDMEEAAELIRWQQENLSDGDYTKAFKGNNEDIQFVTPENPDDDVDETDYVEKNAEILNRNSAYDSDSLWEKDIYKGNEPITSYDDEYEPVPSPENTLSMRDRFKGMMRHHIRSVTRIGVVKIKNRLGEAAFVDDEYNNQNITEYAPENDEAYDDSLWESRMYQGKSKENVPQYSEDFDDSAEVRTETGLENYDGDNLWDMIAHGRILSDSDAIAEEDIAAESELENYNADSLWNDDIYQGRIKEE